MEMDFDDLYINVLLCYVNYCFFWFSGFPLIYGSYSNSVFKKITDFSV